jgi:predicted unusual protein kinase regulating ubiquinone biosynthesis (AarF/ABC1/UbiB family)
MWRRGIDGLLLIAWVGGGYLACAAVTFAWPSLGAAWRARLDPHGAWLLEAHIQRHGGLLVKIGQFIASRPDIFPPPYVERCSALRDQVPPRPFPIIKAALDHAYEGRTADHLARVEPEPLAAASFGQVHRAWLADRTAPGGIGGEVAVKVQYPGLGPSVATDLWHLRLALRLAALALPGWPLGQIHQEITRTSQDEQDYLREGNAAERLRAPLLKHGLWVPAVHWAHTREKVLVMQFAPGTTLARLDIAALGQAERQRLAETIIDGFLEMLLEQGFFHADPHAGNLMYDHAGPDGQPRLWLIDFGMTGAIDGRQRALYRRFLACVRRDDTDGMIDVIMELGVQLPDSDRDALRALARQVYDEFSRMDPRAFMGSARQVEVAGQIGAFIARMHGVVLPQHTIMLARATGLIEGVCMELVPGTNVLELARPRLGRVISPFAEAKRLLSEMREMWRGLRRLPEQVASLRQAPPRQDPLIWGILLIAALQLDHGPWRTAAAICALGGLVRSLLRR